MSNPDYVALHQIADYPGTPVPLASLPLFRSLGAELRLFDPNTGRLDIAYTATADHIQGMGVVAGGVIGTMLDFALSLPVLGMLPSGTPFGTISYNVNLMTALRPGRVLAFSMVERMGGRLAFTSARLIHDDEHQKIIATGTSTISIGS